VHADVGVEHAVLEAGLVCIENAASVAVKTAAAVRIINLYF
jgi:hypothetical protein